MRIEKNLYEAAKAYQDLCVCYRVGKPPTEKLFTRLDKAREAIEAYETLHGKKPK